MARKVIVTGGAGYIGSHTVVELIRRGYEPIILDDFSNSEKKVLPRLEKITGKNVKLYEGKVQDPGFLEGILRFEKNIEAIIHFAAFKAVGESVEKPLLYYDNNLNSTLAILDNTLRNRGIKLIFSSSCTVYGQPDKLPVTENTPRKPAESPYGNTKQICEDFIRDSVGSGKELKALSLRYFNPIGADSSSLIGELPRGIPANLVPFITQAAAGLRPKISVFGNDYSTPDGTCIRDYIHVTDLANAHVKAIEYLDSIGEDAHYDVFNIGVGKGVSVMEIIQSFEEVNDLSLNYEIGPRRSGDIEKIWADTTKVNNLMNWKAQYSLEDALSSAWNWQIKLNNE